jgi:hypothetical protein
MSSQPDNPLAFRVARAERFMNGAAYITLALGYLLGIMLTSQLTLGAFLAFTAVQLLYVATLALVMNSEWRPRHVALPLYALALSALAIASGFLSRTGIYWDWLVYLVTVVVYF